MLRSAPRRKTANANGAAGTAVLRQSVLEVALELGVGTNNHVERWLFSGENIIEEDELEPPPPLSFTPTTAQDSPSPADVFPIPPPFEGRSSFPDTPPPSASKKSGRFGRFLRHDNHGATTGDESEGGYLSEITSKKEYLKQKQKEEKRMRKEVEKRRKQLEKEKKKAVAETDYETDAGYRSAPATGSNKLRKDFKKRPQGITTTATASARAGYETGNDTDASAKKKARPKRSGFFRLGGHGGDTDGEEPPPLPTTIPSLPPVPLPIADKWSRATADALSLAVPDDNAPFGRPDSTLTIDSISSSSNKTITSLGTVRASPLSTTPSSGSSLALSTPTSSAGTTDARSTISSSGSSTTGSRPSVSTTGTSVDDRLSFAVSTSSFSSGRRQGRRASIGTNAGNDEDLAARDYFGAANSTAARNSPLFFVTRNDEDGLEDIDDLPPPIAPGALLRPSSPASSLGRSSRSPTAFFRRALGGGGGGLAASPVPHGAPTEGNSRRISLPNTSALSSRLHIPNGDAKAASMDEPSPYVKVTPPPAHTSGQHRDQAAVAAVALAGAARSPSRNGGSTRNEAVSSSHVPSIVIATTAPSQRTTSPPPSSRSALARSPPAATPSPLTRASRPSSPLPSPRPSFHHEMPPPPSPPPTGPLPPPPPPGQAQAAVPGSPVRSVRSSSHLQQQQPQPAQKAPVVPPTNMYVTLPEPTPEEMRAVSPTPGPGSGHGSGRRRGRGSEARVGSGASHGPPPPSLVDRGHQFGSSSQQQHPQQATKMATRRASSDRAGGVAVMGGPGSSAAVAAAAAQALTHSQSLQHHYQHHQSPLAQHQHQHHHQQQQQQQYPYQQQQHYTQQSQQQQQRAGVPIPVQDRQHPQSHPQPRSAPASGSVPNAPVQYAKLQPAFQTQFQAHRRQPMVQPQPQPQLQQQQAQAYHVESASASRPVRPQRSPRRQYQQDSASDAEHGGASGSSEGHGDHHDYHAQRRQGPQRMVHSQVPPTVNHSSAEDDAPEQYDRETVSRSVFDLGQALASRYESSASDENADGDEVASLSEQDHTHGPRYVEDYYFNDSQQQLPPSYHRATPDAPRSAESADISSVSGDHHDAEDEQDADVSVEDEILPPPRLRPRFSALAKKGAEGEEGDGAARDDRASRGRTTMFTESVYSRSSFLDSETSGNVRENFVKRVRAMFEEEQGAIPPVPRLPAAYR